MGQGSAIEWTEATWNPVTGCSKISPGCKHCYAEVMSKRLRAMGATKYASGFAVKTHRSSLGQPLSWRQPRLVFVNSMSDLFHDAVDEGFIREVFDVMAEAGQHTFQVLTKRPERVLELAPRLPWPSNLWFGVSVEDRARCYRAELLADVPAAVRFLSVEPLLESIPELPLAGIHWVIVGGESGRKPRPVKIEWVRSIRDQCVSARIPFFFKQWGGPNKKKAGRELDGRTWSELPSRGDRQLGLP